MGQVIALKKTRIRPEVVDGLEGQLAKAKCGEMVGSWSIGVTATGGMQLVYSGAFADDPDYAAKMVANGLSAFCEKTGVKKSPPDNIPETDKLPRQLRRSKRQGTH